jgi:hypothetical protein
VLNSLDKVYAQPLFVDGGPGGTDMVIVASDTAVVACKP